MAAKDWISVIGLIITILSLIVAQWKSNVLQKEAATSLKKIERRTEVKLKIYQILLSDRRLSLAHITAEFHGTNPNDTLENSELHKSIYEMLVDDTIVAYPDQTFTANSIEEEDEQEEEDERNEPPRRTSRNRHL